MSIHALAGSRNWHVCTSNAESAFCSLQTNRRCPSAERGISPLKVGPIAIRVEHASAWKWSGRDALTIRRSGRWSTGAETSASHGTWSPAVSTHSTISGCTTRTST